MQNQRMIAYSPSAPTSRQLTYSPASVQLLEDKSNWETDGMSSNHGWPGLPTHFEGWTRHRWVDEQGQPHEFTTQSQDPNLGLFAAQTQEAIYGLSQHIAQALRATSSSGDRPSCTVQSIINKLKTVQEVLSEVVPQPNLIPGISRSLDEAG